MNALQAAVAQVYAAFAGEPRPSQVNGCTNCCISEEELERLTQVPCEELTVMELASYANNAPDTVGEVADYRYFLPRLLELAATNAFEYPGTPFVVRRLRMTPWLTEWQEEERTAIRDFLNAWWEHTLTVDETLGDLDEVIATLCEVDTSGTERYLHTWLASGRVARLRLAWFGRTHITQVALGRSWNVWATAQAARLMYAWLLSGPPARALEQEYDADPFSPDAVIFIEAAGCLVTS